MINAALNKLLSDESIDDINFREVFDEIFSGLANSSTASSFITAFDFKKADMDVYSNAILSARDSIKKLNFGLNKEECIENIQFFPKNDIIDISFITDIICAANSLGVFKYSFSAPYYTNHSFNLLREFDINFENEDINNFDVFEKTNFLYKYLNKETPYFKYALELSHNLPFDNILKYLNLMLNPFACKNCTIGVIDKEKVQFWAGICLKLNYSNSIVVSSDLGYPFISPIGKSYVAEAWKNKIFAYELTPDLIGFKEYPIEDIKCSTYSENKEIIENIFNNKIKGVKYEFSIYNSALALYISKKANSLMDGIDLAKKTIDDGLALEKLEQIKNTYKV